LALIAVGVAVAVAAAVVIAGMTSGGGETAGASGQPSPGALPSGHPSIAAGQEESEPDAQADSDADAASGDAVSLLEARRAEDPGDLGVLLELGDAYFMAQRLTEAEQAYTRALDLKPENAAAQVGLAIVWHAQGDSKRAETALRAVLEEHPDEQDAHYTLAIVCFSSGRIDEAKAEWETAAGIDPTSTTGRRSQSFVDLLEDQQSSAPAAD
jgi:cytochrome c-type biogenesis protein CcmH/NrfG